MRNKPSIFTFDLPIDYVLEYEILIGANTDIVKAKQREMYEMLIALTKIPKPERSISSSSLYGQLPDYLVTHVGFIYLVD